MPTSEKPKVVGSYVVTGQCGPSWGPTRRILTWNSQFDQANLNF